MDRNGDFDTFFDRHHVEVARTLALALGDDARAEDATQEAFAQAYRRWRRVRRMDRPDGWVYVVALNRARRQLGRDARRPDPEPSSRGMTDAATADPTATVALELSLRQALETLTPRQRAALILRYLADLPFASVAEAMGCSVGTAKATVHQALARLRVTLEDEEETYAS